MSIWCGDRVGPHLWREDVILTPSPNPDPNARCGDWDLRTCLPRECARKGLRGLVPPVLTRWCNVKIPFCEVTGATKRKGMDGMLDQLGIELVGHHHLGIDDSRNIARVRFLINQPATPPCF